ncbi:hypothetical protein BP5796_13005 [Coleophoma crateriformis]|uniref:Zn(2)-C6 fungal-type domain-containing protein n=1 Tax=Coleophoma crateriformis TaxID=565419 RepID=A0A3D8Q5K9_9HELO|nr:hypothetical protein BP5796_13005 [Coleophoma crateriformis]
MEDRSQTAQSVEAGDSVKLSRRSHTKSKRGCRRCKVKRIKCDEVHPACQNCVRHHVLCDFASISPPATSCRMPPVGIPPLHRRSVVNVRPASVDTTISDVLSSSRSQSPMQSPIQRSWETSSVGSVQSDVVVYPRPVSLRTPPDLILERRLLTHYLEMCSSNLNVTNSFLNSYNFSGEDVWSNWVVHLALGTPSLMDAILGFSAFHLRVCTAADKEVTRASHRYMAKAIVEQAKQLKEGITVENVEVLFARSTYIACHAVGSQEFLADDSQASTGSLSHWFRPWQGLNTIICSGLECIQNQGIKDMILKKRAIAQSDIETRSTSPREHSFDFLLDDLNFQEVNADTLEAYTSSVAQLETIYARLYQADVFRFAVTAPRRLVELVTINDPRALMIVGYFFMLLKKVGKIWWLDGTVEREFKILMGLLPPRWRPRMDWAVREFETGKG